MQRSLRGEGCTLRERMDGHRFTVKNKTDTPVAKHFSTNEHSLKISVLQTASTAVVQRRLLQKTLDRAN